MNRVRQILGLILFKMAQWQPFSTFYNGGIIANSLKWTILTTFTRWRQCIVYRSIYALRRCAVYWTHTVMSGVIGREHGRHILWWEQRAFSNIR